MLSGFTYIQMYVCTHMYVCSSSLEMTIRLSTRIAQGAPGSPGSHGGGHR